MLQIDHFSNINPYRTIHPVEKALFAFLFLIFSITTKNITIAVFTFVMMSSAILVGAKVPFCTYLKLLFLPFFFLLASVLTIIISFAPAHTEILGSIFTIKLGWWQIYTSPNQLKVVLHLFFTVLASVSCMYFFILTTPINEIVWLLQKLKLPALLIELILLTYRFIFVFLESVKEIRLAQTSRLGYRTFRISIQSIGMLVSSLMLKSMKSAKELQITMDSRGNGQGVHEVEIFHIYQPRNWLLIVSLATILSIFAFVF